MKHSDNLRPLAYYDMWHTHVSESVTANSILADIKDNDSNIQGGKETYRCHVTSHLNHEPLHWGTGASLRIHGWYKILFLWFSIQIHIWRACNLFSVFKEVNVLLILNICCMKLFLRFKIGELFREHSHTLKYITVSLSFQLQWTGLVPG